MTENSVHWRCRTINNCETVLRLNLLSIVRSDFDDDIEAFQAWSELIDQDRFSTETSYDWTIENQFDLVTLLQFT